MKLLILSFALASTLQAAAPPPPDVHAGAARSTACQACHGPQGVSLDEDVPNLAGQKPAYLVAQLTAFKAGERKHDVMNPIARQLSEADIANLAAYWASLPPAAAHADTTLPAVRQSPLKFPDKFPEDFVAYLTTEDVAAGSVTRVYANTAAIAAARAGQALPNGSAIVVATSGIERDANKQLLKDADGHFKTKPPAFYSVMAAVDGLGHDVPELLRNGDWGYALFDGKFARNEAVNYAMCLGCHKAKAQDSYVFSLEALRKHARAP